jgi:hypothetical protein
MSNAIAEEQAANAARQRRNGISSEAWRRELGDPMPKEELEPPQSQTVEVVWWTPAMSRIRGMTVTIAVTGAVRVSTGVRRLLAPTVRIGGLATGEVVLTTCSVDHPAARRINMAGELSGGPVSELFTHGFSADKYRVSQIDHAQKRILIRREDRVTT